MLDREERVGELSRPEVKQAVLEECIVAREEGRWRGGGSGCKHHRPTRTAAMRRHHHSTLLTRRLCCDHQIR